MRSARSSSPLSIFFVLLSTIAIGLLARGGAMIVFRSQLAQDPDHYGVIAGNLATHGCYCLSLGHPTAFRPPLYPLLLTPWSLSGRPSIPAVIVLHLLLSAMIVAGVFLLGYQWAGSRGAVAAALVTALDPLLIHQSTLMMTETLATALAVIALLAFARFCSNPNLVSGLLAGGIIGLAALCRPTFLFWVPLLVLGMLWFHREPLRRRAGNAAIFCAGILLVLSPWTVRNWLVLGHPVIATTHGGYTMLLANNHSFYEYLRGDQREPWSATELDETQQAVFREAKFDERVADRRYQQLAIRAIQREPAMFAYSSLWRIGKLWHLLPERRTAAEGRLEFSLRWAAAGWYLLVYLAAIIGIFRLRDRMSACHWWPVVSLCLAFTLVHAVYWSNIRMRAPLIPSIALLACLAIPSGSLGELGRLHAGDARPPS